MSKSFQFSPTQENQLNQVIYSTPIEGIYYVSYEIRADQRGFFTEISRLNELNSVLDQEFSIKQINLSNSKTNVIRGFHAENWRKLLTVVSGKAFCAFADIRPESKTFGQTLTAVLGPNSDSLQGSFFLPTGIANSFLVLDGPVNYLYEVDRLYKDRDISGDVAISLFDPDLNVAWPIAQEQMIYSQRDVQSISLKQKFPEKF